MISIIIASINPARFSAISAHYAQLLAGEPHEIIGIHDASSLCQAYNRGLQQSTGDILIFSHDDIEIWTPPPHFLPRLKNHLANFDIVGVAGTSKLVSANWFDAGPPHVHGQVAHVAGPNFRVLLYGASARIIPNIHALDGMFLAFRRPVIEALRWDEQTFTGFHLYDLDCTYRAHRAGFKLAVALDLPMLHLSDGNFADQWKTYEQAFLQKHAATLPRIPPRIVRSGGVEVSTKELAISIMNDIADSLK